MKFLLSLAISAAAVSAAPLNTGLANKELHLTALLSSAHTLEAELTNLYSLESEVPNAKLQKEINVITSKINALTAKITKLENDAQISTRGLTNEVDSLVSEVEGETSGLSVRTTGVSLDVLDSEVKSLMSLITGLSSQLSGLLANDSTDSRLLHIQAELNSAETQAKSLLSEVSGADGINLRRDLSLSQVNTEVKALEAQVASLKELIEQNVNVRREIVENVAVDAAEAELAKLESAFSKATAEISSVLKELKSGKLSTSEAQLKLSNLKTDLNAIVTLVQGADNLRRDLPNGIDISEFTGRVGGLSNSVSGLEKDLSGTDGLAIRELSLETLDAKVSQLKSEVQTLVQEVRGSLHVRRALINDATLGNLHVRLFAIKKSITSTVAKLASGDVSQVNVNSITSELSTKSALLSTISTEIDTLTGTGLLGGAKLTKLQGELSSVSAELKSAEAKVSSLGLAKRDGISLSKAPELALKFSNLELQVQKIQAKLQKLTGGTSL